MAKTAGGKTSASWDNEERYRAFLRNSQEGIWRIELEKPLSIKWHPDKQIKHMYQYGYLAECNDAMARMYGFDAPEQLLGARLGDLLIEDDPNNIEYLKAFIKSGYKLSGVESHEKDKDGKDKYFRNSLTGIIENDHILRAWGTQQDVTDQHDAIAEKLKSEARLQLAIKASKLGTWEWNIETGELIWSKELKSLFGLKQNAKITFEKYQKLVHPDDRKVLLKVIEQALKTAEPYSIEQRIFWPDGSVHLILGQGQAFLKDGKPEYIIGTSLNIDEIKQAMHRSAELELKNERLERKRQELQLLNNAKDDFISIASHQLRTPATGVKQYIGMLLEGFAGTLTEEQRTMLIAAYQSNDRQITIVNDLLKVAQIDSGKIKINKQKINVSALIANIVHEQRTKFADRSQQMIIKKPTDKIFCTIDERLFRMIIENLIDNASKYSPPGSNIKVALTCNAHKLEIGVTDNGIGIDKKDLSKLFQKFSRIENKYNSAVEGTGLGLYWSKTATEMHGGKIKVTSTPGKGSTFSVLIPCK
ncbi:MAG: ATP-binding protein [bacterium]|nr:ATP-binding protein [bacterium]